MVKLATNTYDVVTAALHIVTGKLSSSVLLSVAIVSIHLTRLIQGHVALEILFSVTLDKEIWNVQLKRIVCNIPSVYTGLIPAQCQSVSQSISQHFL